MTTGRGRRAALVLDIGSDRTVVWSRRNGMETHPSCVSVDHRGRIDGYGEAALQADGGPGSLVWPLLWGEVRDDLLARSFLRWLVSRSAQHKGRDPILLPLPAATPDHHSARWTRLVESVGSKWAVADRPLAIVLGLGLSPGSERARLVAEVTSDHTEVSVISSGRVATGQLHRPPLSGDHLVDHLGSVLRDLDPDDELDIREEGIHLVAPEKIADSLAHSIADGLGTPVLVTGTEANPAVMGAAEMLIDTTAVGAEVLSRV